MKIRRGMTALMVVMMLSSVSAYAAPVRDEEPFSLKRFVRVLKNVLKIAPGSEITIPKP